MLDIGQMAAVSLGEAQAFARIETGEEEALLAGLLRTASALCEQFIGQLLIERGFEEMIAGDGRWKRLSVTPVNSIASVEMVDAEGAASPLPAGSYEVDIDSRGDGWVKANSPGRLRVAGRAGMAAEANGVPEPLRQGIARLASHLFANRDGESGEPPAAVTALWRPYRRLRLA